MVEWGNYAEAYKAIHGKLEEILAKLDYPSDPAVQDIIDKADRLLGKVYGDQEVVLTQRPTTHELKVQLCHQGTEYQAGGGAGGLVQCQIRNEGDTNWVNEPFARRVQGSQGQDLLQRATTYDLLIQLRHGGTEIDPRQIRALTSGDVVDISDRAARGLGKVDIAGFDVSLPAGTNNIGDVDVVSLESAVTASDSVAAANNTSGLTVSMNNDWRTLVQFRATLGGAGDIYLDASPDGANYYNLWSKSLSNAGSYCDWDLVGFPYFRVRVPTTGIDVAIDIRAVKS